MSTIVGNSTGYIRADYNEAVRRYAAQLIGELICLSYADARVALTAALTMMSGGPEDPPLTPSARRLGGLWLGKLPQVETDAAAIIHLLHRHLNHIQYGLIDLRGAKATTVVTEEQDAEAGPLGVRMLRLIDG